MDGRLCTCGAFPSGHVRTGVHSQLQAGHAGSERKAMDCPIPRPTSIRAGTKIPRKSMAQNLEDLSCKGGTAPRFDQNGYGTSGMIDPMSRCQVYTFFVCLGEGGLLSHEHLQAGLARATGYRTQRYPCVPSRTGLPPKSQTTELPNHRSFMKLGGGLM